MRTFYLVAALVAYAAAAPVGEPIPEVAKPEVNGDYSSIQNASPSVEVIKSQDITEEKEAIKAPEPAVLAAAVPEEKPVEEPKKEEAVEVKKEEALPEGKSDDIKASDPKDVTTEAAAPVEATTLEVMEEKKSEPESSADNLVAAPVADTGAKAPAATLADAPAAPADPESSTLAATNSPADSVAPTTVAAPLEDTRAVRDAEEKKDAEKSDESPESSEKPADQPTSPAASESSSEESAEVPKKPVVAPVNPAPIAADPLGSAKPQQPAITTTFLEDIQSKKPAPVSEPAKKEPASSS